MWYYIELKSYGCYIKTSKHVKLDTATQLRSVSKLERFLQDHSNILGYESDHLGATHKCLFVYFKSLHTSMCIDEGSFGCGHAPDIEGSAFNPPRHPTYLKIGNKNMNLPELTYEERMCLDGLKQLESDVGNTLQEMIWVREAYISY